jgi:hypothetical protein
MAAAARAATRHVLLSPLSSPCSSVTLTPAPLQLGRPSNNVKMGACRPSLAPSSSSRGPRGVGVCCCDRRALTRHTRQCTCGCRRLYLRGSCRRPLIQPNSLTAAYSSSLSVTPLPICPCFSRRHRRPAQRGQVQPVQHHVQHERGGGELPVLHGASWPSLLLPRPLASVMDNSSCMPRLPLPSTPLPSSPPDRPQRVARARARRALRLAG